MTERTFRAVVASVLVGALALAVVVAVALLPRPVEPAPTITTGPATPLPSASATPSPGPVLAAPSVVGVGQIPRGASSGDSLELRFVEMVAGAVPDAPGSFRVTLTDQAGDGSTVSFVGTPSVVAPGSLGATASFAAPNVLVVSIAGSDTVNLEPITISGLGIRTSQTAATGPLQAGLSAFTGSLAGGATSNVLPSPGSVTASP